MVGMAPLSLLSNVSNKSVDCDDLCLLKPNEKAGCVGHWVLAQCSILLVTRLVLATSPHPEAISPTHSHLTSLIQILLKGLTVIDRRHLSPRTTKKMT